MRFDASKVPGARDSRPSALEPGARYMSDAGQCGLDIVQVEFVDSIGLEAGGLSVRT
jgi:hypothetical protein